MTRETWWRKADGTMSDGGSAIVATAALVCIFAIVVIANTTHLLVPVDHLLRTIFRW